MATILFAWELGGGLGHTLPLVPLVERLCGRGHRVVLLVREVGKAAKLFAGLGATCLQAPYLAGRADGRTDGLRTFPHILHSAGFGDPTALRTLAEAWRSRYEQIRPDLILAEHSPTAVLAARATGTRTAVVGTGFCCPPDVQPFPDLRTWLPPDPEGLDRDERRVLDNVNRLLHAWRLPALTRLGQPYGQVAEVFLTTFAELPTSSGRRGRCKKRCRCAAKCAAADTTRYWPQCESADANPRAASTWAYIGRL